MMMSGVVLSFTIPTSRRPMSWKDKRPCWALLDRTQGVLLGEGQAWTYPTRDEARDIARGFHDVEVVRVQGRYELVSREDTSPCNAPLMSSRTKKCVLQAGHAGAHEFPKYAE